jgi:hypothetical protein
MQHQIIYRREQHYASFPHVACTAAGELLVVFREAGPETAAAALKGTHTHQDPDSRILFCRSNDGAKTWSAPLAVYAGDEYAASDPALTVLRDGRLLVRYGRWKLVQRNQRRSLAGPVMRHYLRRGLLGMMAGNGFMHSVDHGSTWLPLQSEVTESSLARAMTREAPLELADGTLLLPVYDGYPWRSESSWLLRSWDGGTTWEDASLIAGPLNLPKPYRCSPNYNETALLGLAETTLLAVVRVDGGFVSDDGAFISEGGLGELAWTISHDLGFTWSSLQTTGLWGQPAHLLRLRDGRLLCTYGYRRSPYGVGAALFTIDNNKWQTTHQIALREDGAGWDLGYPASVQLPDGDLYTVYYFHGKDGLRHIAGTRWRVQEMDETGERASK